jgi:hypothetical protein
MPLNVHPEFWRLKLKRTHILTYKKKEKRGHRKDVQQIKYWKIFQGKTPGVGELTKALFIMF